MTHLTKTIKRLATYCGNMTKHETETIKFYAHDYRDMAMKEDDLSDMLNGFVESFNCNHVCSSNCRRVGCNCNCGEFHF